MGSRPDLPQNDDCGQAITNSPHEAAVPDSEDDVYIVFMRLLLSPFSLPKHGMSCLLRRFLHRVTKTI